MPYHQHPDYFYAVGLIGFDQDPDPTPTNYSMSITVQALGTPRFKVYGDGVPTGDLNTYFSSYNVYYAGTVFNHDNPSVHWSIQRGYIFVPEITPAATQYYKVSFVMHGDTFNTKKPVHACFVGVEGMSNWAYHSQSPTFQNDYSCDSGNTAVHTHMVGTVDWNLARIIEMN
jgi:hypothetical protein